MPSREYSTITELQVELGELNSPRRVLTPRSGRVAAWIFASILVAAALALIFLPWMQTVSGTGRVIAYSPNERQQNIEAPVDGRISKWLVLEGERVTEGQIIAEISDIDPQIMERLERERDAADARLSAANTGLLTSQKNVERQKILAAKGLSSQRQFELANLEYQALQREVATATAELARIQVRLSRQASQVITAPRNGQIMRVLTAQGGVFVKAGTLLALLVPETDDRAVELYVDGNDLPLLSVGRSVRLQFEGWPAIQFSGWPSVAVGTFGGTIGVIDASDDGTGKFRILVFPDSSTPWPGGLYLRQGVRVVGWVLLDSVRLGWELWRQFNGFPPTVSLNAAQQMIKVKK